MNIGGWLLNVTGLCFPDSRNAPHWSFDRVGAWEFRGRDKRDPSDAQGDLWSDRDNPS